MRITVHLDTFQCADVAYAVLWLDRESRKWSREGHAVIDLPAWGALTYPQRNTRIHGAGHDRAICELTGLNLGSPASPCEGESGQALWYRHAHHAPIPGKWHIQCVDNAESDPENGVFAEGGL
ncbi:MULTISPECIES: DUF3564 domain-containing protein [Paraburkholderia]|jgi:hypothetical protein|uniref:DUF3564 domain-containing protein n=1 Tax=Paraburkholderia TaxID=1822464 RepID=UPI0006D42412|nr:MULTISPECIES: DUF3564 domain-containing protein [Paraburkholderia]ALP67110.1 hypothetical protein AN416_30870 [Paraburkholderia caribensis]AMV47687.1 hypothetical protein ATN79_44255 [Paraburkholderia caribensis]AUT56816.1 DUF3564 domain-containing protein [Paraburkholderia caribensis]CAG9239540.1 conserved hypothetical protein [Paraburkholderia caribensis]